MRSWKVLSLVLLLVLSGRLPAEEPSERLDALDAQIRGIKKEQQDLQRQLTELELQLTELVKLRDQLAFEAGAGDGVYIVTAMAANLRNAPDVFLGEVLAEVPEGTRLRAVAFSDSFWKVEYRGDHVYLSDIFTVKDEQARSYLEKQGIALNQSDTAETTTQAKPESQPGLNSSTRASVQCSAYTKKGARCRRMTTNPSGRCFQHE